MRYGELESKSQMRKSYVRMLNFSVSVMSFWGDLYKTDSQGVQ